jgi:hypothetical protein
LVFAADGPFVLNDMRLLIDAALQGAGLASQNYSWTASRTRKRTKGQRRKLGIPVWKFGGA